MIEQDLERFKEPQYKRKHGTGFEVSAMMLEPGEIDHFESARNDQSRLIRNSQCTSMTN